MLTCVPVPSVDYYLRGHEGQQFEYYLDGESEGGGIWWTSFGSSPVGAFRDCIDGQAIDPGVFVALCAGRTNDDQMVPRAGGIRRPGYDLHLAAPKSVSLLALLFPNRGREIVGVHDEAVRRTLRFINAQGFIETRTGKSGRDRCAAGAIVAAIFRHGSSRPGDPQLHSHCLIPNTALRSDGSVGAIDNNKLLKMQRLAGAIYSAELAAGMRRAGYSVEIDGKSFAVMGVPQEAVDLFSKGRKKIEKIGLENGFDPSVDRRLAQKANLRVRPKKSSNETLIEQRERWLSELRASGIDIERFPNPSLETTKLAPPDLEELVRLAVDDAFDKDSVLRLPLVLARVAEYIQIFCDGDQVEQALERYLPSYLINLTPEEKRADHNMVTTPEIVRLEKEMLEGSSRGRNSRTYVPESRVEETIEAHPALSEDQKASVRHALNRDRISIVEGAAGAGKSFSTGVSAAASRGAGLEVWALAPSWSAAKVIAADTKTDPAHARALTGWLADVERGKISVGPNSIIFLDESGMCGTRPLSRLLAISEAADCKIVLSGDSEQLKPVGAGSPFLLLSRLLGSSRLSEVKRQVQPWSRAASMRFARGLADEALQAYDQRGCVSWCKDRQSTIDNLADRYLADIVHDDVVSKSLDASSVVITNRNEDVRELNREIRHRLKALGSLGDDDVQIDVAQRDDDSKKLRKATLALAKGDRIAFGETVAHAQRSIRNADVARVTEISEQGDITLVFEPDGQVVNTRVADLIGARRNKEPPFPAIRHIYACTVHFSQGLTVDRAYVAALHPTDRNAIYVAMTRHRHSAQLFVDLRRLRSSDTGARGKGASATRTLETLKAAFYKECLVPARKLNACDFVADLQSLLAPAPKYQDTRHDPYLEAKNNTLNRMKRRVAQSLGEGVLPTLEGSVSGMPNAIFALSGRVLGQAQRAPDHSASVWDWVKGLPAKVRDAVRAMREVKSPTLRMNPRRRYRVKDSVALVLPASEAEPPLGSALVVRAVEEPALEP